MSGATNEVTAVVVTHNSEAVVPRCLASLEGIERIIVVDNASRDATIAACRAAAQRVEIVASPANVGYARACNLGLERVTTPFVLFLNPDAMLKPGALDALSRAAKAFPDAALLGPALENLHGDAIATHDASRLRRQRRASTPAELPSGPCCVGFLLGAVLLARTGVLKALGGFDGSVFLFYEDDDLCERVRQAGRSTLFVPAARATHLWGHSSSGLAELSAVKAWHMSWSRLYMLEKHRGKGPMRREALLRILYHGMRALGFALLARRGHARRSIAGLRGALAYLAGKDCFEEAAR